MKKRKELELYINKIISKYQNILLLSDRTFDLKYGCEHNSAIAECVFNYPYKNVTIKYSDKLYKMWEKKEDIVPFVVHEMCHCITDELYSKALERFAGKNEIEDARESLTDYMCNIIIKNKLK